eukprot:362907-Chlamydomonas_euryale.AAC.12
MLCCPPLPFKIDLVLALATNGDTSPCSWPLTARDPKAIDALHGLWRMVSMPPYPEHPTQAHVPHRLTAEFVRKNSHTWVKEKGFKAASMRKEHSRLRSSFKRFCCIIGMPLGKACLLTFAVEKATEKDRGAWQRQWPTVPPITKACMVVSPHSHSRVVHNHEGCFASCLMRAALPTAGSFCKSRGAGDAGCFPHLWS